MPLKRSVLLLPGYELDGFPRTASSEQADELLSGWISLWHPRLLLETGQLPSWEQVEHLPDQIDGSLFVIPSICDASKPDDLETTIDSGGGKIVRATAPWTELRETLLSTAAVTDAVTDGQEAPTAIDESALEKFAALGYTYLQIQLMTRQLRYSTMLDVPSLEEQVLDAARAAIAGDSDEMDKWLQAGFDSIGQERDHYYSLDVHLIDVTLTAETTLKKSLDRQMTACETTPTALLASASILRKLSQDSPDRFARLQGLITDEKICVTGGLDVEHPHPLLTRDTIIDDILHGREAYEQLGLKPPTVFGRMDFGQLSNGASLLRRLGFDGTLLVSFGDGEYPASNQAKMTWESNDGMSIAGLSGEVFDASNPASFLALGWEVGDALDHQHVPTVIFAHWPGQTCLYKRLVEIAAEATPALGRWKLLSKYFTETDDPYHQERLDEAGFRYNWLGATLRPDSLLAKVDTFHQIAVRMRSLRTLMAMHWLAVNHPSTSKAKTSAESTTASPANYQAATDSDWAPELARLQETWTQFEQASDCGAEFDALNASLQKQVSTVTDRLGQQISGTSLSKSLVSNEAPTAEVVFNPSSSPVRESITTGDGMMLADCTAKFSEGRAGEKRISRVDVPSLGFVCAPLVEATGQATGKPLAEVGGLLRNEFLQAQIDTSRGHLRSLHFPNRRGNRLSLQIARRVVDHDGEMHYCAMDASTVRMLTSSNVQGLVRSTGRFVDNGKACGKFEIDYSVDAGGRLLNVHIKLDDLSYTSDDPNPWINAYVIRIAWVNEAAILRTHSAEGSRTWTGTKAIAPLMIHIDEADYHTHYLTGGLSFHRKTGPRFLETILAAKGQQSVRQRIAIGVDLPTPLQTAARVLDQAYCSPISLPTPSFSSGWFFTTDLQTVDMSIRCPLVDDGGKNVGVRLSIEELSGKSSTVQIRSMHDVQSALRIDYLGNKANDLTVEGDQVTLPLRANEHTWIDVLWA